MNSLMPLRTCHQSAVQQAPTRSVVRATPTSTRRPSTWPSVVEKRQDILGKKPPLPPNRPSIFDSRHYEALWALGPLTPPQNSYTLLDSL